MLIQVYTILAIRFVFYASTYILDNDRSSLDPFSYYFVDAVFSLALLFQWTIDSGIVYDSSTSEHKGQYSKLSDDFSFDGITGKVDFTNTGDRTIPSFQALSYSNKSEWIKVAEVDASSTWVVNENIVFPNSKKSNEDHWYGQQRIPHCPPGNEPLIKSSDNIYVCYPCGVNYYKYANDSSMCIPCEIGGGCLSVGTELPCILEGNF